MADQIACPFCREAISASAIKCRYCHEFLPGAPAKKEKEPSKSILPDVMTLAGKAFIPVVIVVLALAYKPTIEGLLTRTSQAEFFGTKLVFEHTKAFTGSLTPTELYYLIGSAGRYGREFDTGGLNLDVLEAKRQVSVIYSLRDKGLLETRISDNTPELAAKGFGKRTISTRPTEKGKNFLVELGLRFDGKSFPEAP